MKIGVIGEFRRDFAPHTKLVQALGHVEAQCGLKIEIDWIGTLKVEANSAKVNVFFASTPLCAAYPIVSRQTTSTCGKIRELRRKVGENKFRVVLSALGEIAK